MDHRFNDTKTTDRYDLVLDLVENPGKYSPGRIREILSDKESLEIYRLICATASAANCGIKVDIESEWERFSRRHCVRKRFAPAVGRAASIAAFTIVSVAAVAIGIAVSVSIDKKAEPVSAEPAVQQCDKTVTSTASDTVAENHPLRPEPVLFEDTSLETIMSAISSAYDLKVVFNDSHTASLHLFYKFDPALPVEEIVSQLNMFEQIKISLDNDTIIID